MIAQLRYINNMFPFCKLTLQLYLRFFRQNHNEGVVERELHSDYPIHQKVLYCNIQFVNNLKRVYLIICFCPILIITW
jgi:hypothetical protein